MNPQTKYAALKYHHFRSYVTQKIVTILPIDTKEQATDVSTKAFPDVHFCIYVKKIADGNFTL